MIIKDELEIFVKQLAKNMPETIKSEVIDNLMIAFGLKQPSDMPQLNNKMLKVLPDGRKTGQLWNDIKLFYPYSQTGSVIDQYNL